MILVQDIPVRLDELLEKEEYTFKQED